jgi:hypothetical protein
LDFTKRQELKAWDMFEFILILYLLRSVSEEYLSDYMPFIRYCEL